MTKIWGNLFSISRKWVKSKRRKRKEERAKVGNNNDQLLIATPPHVVHARRLGQYCFNIQLIYSVVAELNLVDRIPNLGLISNP